MLNGKQHIARIQSKIRVITFDFIAIIKIELFTTRKYQKCICRFGDTRLTIRVSNHTSEWHPKDQLTYNYHMYFHLSVGMFSDDFQYTGIQYNNASNACHIENQDSFPSLPLMQ